MKLKRFYISEPFVVIGSVRILKIMNPIIAKNLIYLKVCKAVLDLDRARLSAFYVKITFQLEKLNDPFQIPLNVLVKFFWFGQVQTPYRFYKLHLIINSEEFIKSFFKSYSRTRFTTNTVTANRTSSMRGLDLYVVWKFL